jgi:hypothetical protein
MRTSVLNERLWHVDIDGTKDVLNIVERLVAQMRRMKERGFKVSPVTVGLCEKDPSICFGQLISLSRIKQSYIIIYYFHNMIKIMS